MRKSKIIFGIIAAVTIIACLLLAIFSGAFSDKAPPGDNTEQATTPVEDETIDVPDVTGEIDTDPTDPPIIIRDNVTINQVKKDPKEVIDRNPVVSANDPEYLEVENTSPYLSPEGRVYRNDKTISIEIADQQNGDVYTFSFGYITGKCNRFLYLNPVFERNGENIDSNIYYKFGQPIGGGSLTTCGIDVDENIEENKKLNYTFTRALEEKAVAGYVDPKHPGTFWFTQTPIENNIYIDVQAHYYQGGMFATLRLTIAKDKDGTYSIIDIDDKNLLINGDNSEYSLKELEYIVDVANETYHTPGKVHSYNSLQLEWQLTKEDCIIELRDSDTGLYFNQFIPDSGTEWTREYTDSMIPVIAVSYRWKGLPTQTMYFWVITEPTSGNHGEYQFIGYDFPLYQTIDVLEGYGYIGSG